MAQLVQGGAPRPDTDIWPDASEYDSLTEPAREVPGLRTDEGDKCRQVIILLF